MIERFKELYSQIKTGETLLTPSEWTEKNVVLTSDVSSIVGKFKYDITPYMREVVDTLGQFHPAKIIGLMAGAQLGKTQGLIVPGTLYIMSNNPGSILSLSANDRLSKEFVTTRLDPAIKSAGMQHLIRPNVIKKRNQRSGDTSDSKEFLGGVYYAGGMQSFSGLIRQRSIKNLFADDWDAAPKSDKEEGDTFALLQHRFKTFKNEMKQCYISTPKTKPSNIESVYLMGDQRRWNVPCPCCGEYIVLEWVDAEDRDHGIIYNLDKKGKLIEESVKYKCQLCSGEFSETNKYDINLKGKWIPTAEPDREGIYSYHISSIYAPPHAYGWKDMVYEWLAIFNQGNESQSKKKAFYNQSLGIPWEEKQEQIKENALINHSRDYDIGTIPLSMSNDDGSGQIVLLTCACDLNGNLDDCRLDYEVLAHAASGSTYSIDQGSIGTYQPGIKKDIVRTKFTYRHGVENSAWDVLDIVIRKDYYYNDDHQGRLKILQAGIDVGYMENYAWEFINKNTDICIGIKGSPNEKYNKIDNNIKFYNKSKNIKNQYNLESNIVKDVAAEKINLDWKQKESKQPDGYMNFPNPGNGKYSPRFFVQFESEQKVLKTNDDGNATEWKWEKKSGHQNHFFDTFCYNVAARDIFMEMFFKAAGVKDGKWPDFAEMMTEILTS